MCDEYDKKGLRFLPCIPILMLIQSVFSFFLILIVLLHNMSVEATEEIVALVFAIGFVVIWF